nr:uncharacterized protein LOC109169864 [Ipomoea batatas]
MKKLTKSALIGSKRKHPQPIIPDQENASCIELSNNHTPKHGNGSQFPDPYVYGVFENSINSPLSIITHSGQLIKSSIACNKNQSQSVISNEDDFSRNLQAEADEIFAIQRSQRLTFQKGTAVVDSQQLLIDNIHTVKVDIMPPLAGKKNVINL